jgi:hypothetical protein
VGQKLTGDRLADEEPSRPQDADDLPQRAIGITDVMAGPEIDDEIKPRVRKGQGTYISVVKIRGYPSFAKASAGESEEPIVDIETHEEPGTQGAGDRGQGDTTPAAHFQDPASRRQPQKLNHHRDLDVFLHEVASGDIRKRFVRMHARTLNHLARCVESLGSPR